MEAAPAVDMGALAGALDLLRQAGAEERRKRKGQPRPEPDGSPAAAHAAGRATLARAFPGAAPEAPLPEPPLRLKKRAWGRAALIPHADTLPSPHKNPVSPIVRRPGPKTFR
jgi:hypothetical protein